MKQLICEMCGGNDLIKQDGAYVCQNCGTKYSVEEAKKMMVEGTVKIDNSEQVKNYIALAKSSLKNRNLKDCLKYCNMALEFDAKNREALKIKARYYEQIEGHDDSEISTLKSISDSNVIDDTKIEFLFEYIDGFNKDENDIIEIDDFVSYYCQNEIIDIKNKENAIKLYRHLIRANMNDLLRENDGKTVNEIIQNFNDVSTDVIGTSKYEDDEEIDFSLEIKILAKKIKELDDSYKYTDDEIIIYKNKLDDEISYLAGSRIVKSIENDEVTEYELKEYSHSIANLNAALEKIRKVDPSYVIEEETQDKLDEIQNTTDKAFGKMKINEKKKQSKSTLGSITLFISLFLLVAMFACFFSANIKGGVICVIALAVSCGISSIIEKH